MRYTEKDRYRYDRRPARLRKLEKWVYDFIKELKLLTLKDIIKGRSTLRLTPKKFRGKRRYQRSLDKWEQLRRDYNEA